MANKEREQVKRRIDVTEEEIDLFVRNLELFLQSELADILKDIDQSTNKLESAQLLGRIVSILEEKGLSKEIDKLTQIYGKELKLAADVVQTAIDNDIPIYSDADYSTVEQLIKLDTSLVKSEIVKTSYQVSSTVMRSVITGEQVDYKGLSKTFGTKAARQLKTELSTTISGFYRSVTKSKAQEFNIKYFVYLGPDDGITRPFCDAKINKIYTQEQINKWDNGQGIPASIYLGGYNCRHDLVPISQERAEQRIKEGLYKWG